MKQILSRATIYRLSFIWAMVGMISLFGRHSFTTGMSNIGAGLSFVILLITIIVASFGVVKQADQLAHKLGEPYGTLILTLSIASIEVILISAVMLGPAESSSTIGKDSTFSVMMIIMNLVIGLCILLGNLRHKEQEYNASGALTYFAMIIILGGTALILPNFVIGKGTGEFTFVQSIAVAIIVFIIYAFFLKYQITDYRHLYVQPEAGMMDIPYPRNRELKPEEVSFDKDVTPLGTDKSEIFTRSIILILMILPIVLLSHNMATVVDFGIAATGLPISLGGVLIAMIVFIPESITAIQAARNNEFQRTINLCHGAFVSTVGLTVPAVLIVGLVSSKPVLFGLSPSEMILFVLTLLLSLISFQGRRTSPILGVAHLGLFALFVLLIFAG
ncbi:calcium:proton antiporter [Sphingobacterium corticis]|uniref:Calcium:proton antiporter n=1 Tax=Sphingobacterium corticis TaxID=1812823 RepID=A0ABW5NJC3_9SPHI